jgi:hypothetical protein
MGEIDNEVRVEIYRHFLDAGTAPTYVEIADALDLTPMDALASFRRLGDDHVIVLAPGSTYIWMANPFSAIPTTFIVRAGGREWWGNCIWDSFGIAAMVGVDAEVSTSCPDCGEPLAISVVGGRVGHDHRVIHYSVPAARWWDDIGAT